ncbi:hypothetical protein HAX54_013235 [Datura stramonium]|uniref:Uncharacterized protein n=1 Tax=Datura stramonium TaxID=4076 RepID=A0ABS8TMU2_DATST|nr:hypothetical protein [Datura stramonium]
MILFGQIASDKFYVPFITVFLNKFLDNKPNIFLLDEINIDDSDNFDASVDIDHDLDMDLELLTIHGLLEVEDALVGSSRTEKDCSQFDNDRVTLFLRLFRDKRIICDEEDELQEMIRVFAEWNHAVPDTR